MTDARAPLSLLLLALFCVPSVASWTEAEALSAANSPITFIGFLEDLEGSEELFESRQAMRRICNKFRGDKHDRPETPTAELIERAARGASRLLDPKNTDECRKAASYLLYLYAATPSLAVLEAALENHRFILWVESHSRHMMPVYELPELTETSLAEYRALLDRSDPEIRGRILRILKLYLAADEEKSPVLPLPADLHPELLRSIIVGTVKSGGDLLVAIPHDDIENPHGGRLELLLEMLKEKPSPITQAISHRLDLFVEFASENWLRNYAKRAPEGGKSLLEGRWPVEKPTSRTMAESIDERLERERVLKEKLRALLLNPIQLPSNPTQVFHRWMKYLKLVRVTECPSIHMAAQVLLLILDPEEYRVSRRLSEQAAEVIRNWHLVEEVKQAVGYQEFLTLFMMRSERELIDSTLFSVYFQDYGDTLPGLESALSLLQYERTTVPVRTHLYSVDLSKLSAPEKVRLSQRAQSMLEPVEGKRLSRWNAKPVRHFLRRLGVAPTCAGEIEDAG